MRRLMMIIPGLLLSSAVAWAGEVDEATERETKKDVVLRALVDELERGMAGLKLSDLERPYFIEYGLTDSINAGVTAELGATVSKNTNRNRYLRAGVRVGSYELDNTNFGGGGWEDYGDWEVRRTYGGLFGGAEIPIEDDYDAIRQAIWWMTDRQYKGVVEQLEKKKAFMESKVIRDKPDDFSRETPAVYYEERAELSVDVDRLETMAQALSGIFREHPQIKNSNVSLGASVENGYLVNSEGTRLRSASWTCSVAISAKVQADDGMELADSISVKLRKLDQLPSLEELSGRCRSMIEKLIAVKNAPQLETYSGPVLFEARPAASLFSGHFAHRFGGGQRPVGSETPPDDFANKLNKRILPRFIDVVDDPALETIAGAPVMGHYRYDDQGVPAQRVALVEDGRLKALLMSRNPSKEFARSTGHGRGGYGASASIGCLLVTAKPGLDALALKQELLETCQDEDLEYGVRITSLGGANGGGYWSGFYSEGFGGYGTTPLLMYKVYPDGREELVRGAQIAHIDLRAFKRILAAGNEPYVLNSGGQNPTTIAVPALLFEELDLAKIDRDFDKPPILPTPLVRGETD